MDMGVEFFKFSFRISRQTADYANVINGRSVLEKVYQRSKVQWGHHLVMLLVFHLITPLKDYEKFTRKELVK